MSNAAVAEHKTESFTLRANMRKGDDKAVRHILVKAGVFSEEEIDVGSGMAAETFEKGSQQSGLDFIFIDGPDGSACAYACIGPTPITQQSWDFFWLAVDPACQGHGLARRLTEAACARMARLGGRWLFAETSGMPHYEPARRFYAANGFELMATIPDFYKPGDQKFVFRKDATAP